MKIKKRVVILFVFILILPFLFAKDHDRDGIQDENDKFPYDFDNDGIPDKWEIKYNLKYDFVDSNLDPDNDGVSNLDEYLIGTNPHYPNHLLIKQQQEKSKGFFNIKGNSNLVALVVIIPIIIILIIIAIVVFNSFDFEIPLKQIFKDFTFKNKKQTFNDYLSGSDMTPVQSNEIDMFAKQYKQNQNLTKQNYKKSKLQNIYRNYKLKKIQKKYENSKNNYKVETKSDVFDRLKKLK
jgi:thrombospondin type 3 repeat protein